MQLTETPFPLPDGAKRRPHHLSRGQILFWSGLLGLFLVSLLVFGLTSLTGLRGTAEDDGTDPASWDEPNQENGILTVTTIRPKRNALFVRSVEEPAYVEAYYRADLFARVAGTVKYIQKNIGDAVKEGELLAEIDVPDLTQEIFQKEALIKQAQADLQEAEANADVLKETVETSRLAIEAKQSELDRYAALRDFQQAQLSRVRRLAERETVTAELVDEKLKELRAAEAAYKSAEVAVKLARSDFRVDEAKLRAAQADLEVKRSRIAVAREDCKRVEAMADLAKIRAPFNGVIADRGVDPGSFVQNATTARTKPIVSLVCVDRVTVSMMVPEPEAPFVSNDMPAIIHIDALPGQPIRTRVSRFAPLLDPEKGRELRVEVDLYNPPEPSYTRSVEHGITSFLGSLSASGAVDGAILLVSGEKVWGRRGRLLPGMYGKMRLVLQQFENAYVIPANAKVVLPPNNKTYLLQVKDGIVVRVPVRVQWEDGVQAKVAVIVREANPATGEEEVLQDLTGDEEILRNGRADLAPGQEVKSTLVDW